MKCSVSLVQIIEMVLGLKFGFGLALIGFNEVFSFFELRSMRFLAEF